ncbi:hypothetical protein PC118_g21304 [Phytophthora cactorum]|uniref:Uncharacterized protein n=1 Tax=Phytophthora cactorum TaxID=29920 RepID=A0A8T1F0G5_9STRA|nr:hypothetical protein PC118_g21304 [Phytophthora cactorum]
MTPISSSRLTGTQSSSPGSLPSTLSKPVSMGDQSQDPTFGGPATSSHWRRRLRLQPRV